jgi:hypothetical protein
MVLAPKIGRTAENVLTKAALTVVAGKLQFGGLRVHLAYGGGQAFRRRSAKYR